MRCPAGRPVSRLRRMPRQHHQDVGAKAPVKWGLRWGGTKWGGTSGGVTYVYLNSPGRSAPDGPIANCEWKHEGGTQLRWCDAGGGSNAAALVRCWRGIERSCAGAMLAGVGSGSTLARAARARPGRRRCLREGRALGRSRRQWGASWAGASGRRQRFSLRLKSLRLRTASRLLA